jgi:peptidoglycan/LPS O-acetylase OafA/YrhL
MNKLVSKTITSIKYIYLIVFFALLAGFFHPIITRTSFDNVIIGTLILFVGLAGGVLVFKAISSERKSRIFFGGGFGLITISLYFVFQMTGRS